VDKHWEAARGFALTDEIRVTIAANAALLGLALGLDAYRGVGAIVVHRSGMRLRGERSVGVAGVVTDDAMPVLGHANLHGPVVVAWDAVVADTSRPGRAHNLVHHEFAHKLDMLDGYSDGTPPLGDANVRQRWVEVRDRELARLREGATTLALRSYAGENEAEFFAVATEAFFDVPYALADNHPDLYALLCGIYQQDPLTRPLWYWPVRESGSSAD
jgi:MtfA peptidase